MIYHLFTPWFVAYISPISAPALPSLGPALFQLPQPLSKISGTDPSKKRLRIHPIPQYPFVASIYIYDMCIYIYVCVYIYICMCIYIYVCVCIYMYMYVCVCMCVVYVYILSQISVNPLHAPWFLGLCVNCRGRGLLRD